MKNTLIFLKLMVFQNILHQKDAHQLSLNQMAFNAKGDY